MPLDIAGGGVRLLLEMQLPPKLIAFWQRLTAFQRLSLISLLFFLVILPVGIWLALSPTSPFSRASGEPITPPTSPSPSPVATTSPTSCLPSIPTSQAFTFSSGWNLVGLTFDNTQSSYNAENFLQELNRTFVPASAPGHPPPAGNKIVGVYRYNSTSGQWQVHTAGRTDDTNFSPVAREGYFIRTTWPGTATRSANLVGRSISLPFQAGWNLISLPYVPSGIPDAQTFLQRLNGAGIQSDTVAKLQGGRYVLNLSGNDANNFNLAAGEGYWVRTTASSVPFFTLPDPENVPCPSPSPSPSPLPTPLPNWGMTVSRSEITTSISPSRTPAYPGKVYSWDGIGIANKGVYGPIQWGISVYPDAPADLHGVEKVGGGQGGTLQQGEEVLVKPYVDLTNQALCYTGQFTGRVDISYQIPGRMEWTTRWHIPYTINYSRSCPRL